MIQGEQIKGSRVILRSLEEQDIKALLPFFKEPENLYYYLPTEPKAYDLTSLIAELQGWNDGENLAWVVLYDKHIAGLVNFEGIDNYSQTAELGVMLLPEYRGQGLARECAEVIIEYGFCQMDLRRISARVMSGNNPSFRLLSSLKFRLEGIMYRAMKRPDDYLDLYHFALLREDWLKSND